MNVRQTICVPQLRPFCGRFQESKLFEQLFEEIVARCLEAGLVQGNSRIKSDCVACVYAG